MTRMTIAYMTRCALALWLLATALLSASAARAADETPDLALRLWTTPTRAARGDIVAYEILLDNNNDVSADRVRVTLPFSPHMRVIRTEFDNRATWVSELSQDKLTVMFGRLPGQADRRAKLYFQISQDAPDGLEVRVRATVRYEGDRDEKVHSNYTALTIGGQDTDTQPQATVEPSTAPAGTRLTVRVRNYYPDERVSTWLNTASGVRETRLSSSASASGDVVMELNTTKLAAGAYSLVVYGESSKTTIVVPFTLQ